MCVLATLAHGDSYGYQIIKDMPQALEMTESTLYPILRRLKAQGSLSEYAQEHGGRMRKYYTITPLGTARLALLLEEWHLFTASVEGVLSEG
jgi:PadR family transcriptional regulator PadR